MADGDSTGEHKCCTKCLQTKPLIDFHRATRGLHGRQSVCKQCTSDAAARRYAENRGEILGKYLARYHAKQQPLREAKERAKAERLACPIKQCPRCGETKRRDEFGKASDRPDGLKVYCKPCHNAGNKATRAKHIEKHRAIEAAWRDANRDRIRAKSKAWRQANPDRAREQAYDWRRRNPRKQAEGMARYHRLHKQDVEYKLAKLLRCGLWAALRGLKGGRKTTDLLGFTVEELKRHLERQFTKGMSWSNYGEWHIDHITPLSTFRIASIDDPELKAAWGLGNLRPLWATDNMKKRAKVTHLL